MKYEKELRQLINNFSKQNRCTTDDLINCPQPNCGAHMDFRISGIHGSWCCLGMGCGFTIPGEELPGPDVIKRLIEEVKSEKTIEKIKNIIREAIQKEV